MRKVRQRQQRVRRENTVGLKQLTIPEKEAAIPFTIERQIVHGGYDRKTCWVHARPGVIPGEPPIGIITAHPLRLTGMDVFYEISDLRSDDGGQTWSGFTPHKEAFARRPLPGGREEGVSDLTPLWHEATGKLLGTGHTVVYQDDALLPSKDRPRSTSYSCYDPETREWSAWKKLEMPDGFFNAGAGSTQRHDLPDGEILLPIYYVKSGGGSDKPYFAHSFSTVLRCSFDGKTLKYIEHGAELTHPDPRSGFCEPSIARAAGRYFLTLRNYVAGHVAVSDDGLNYGEPIPWLFDDGAELGSYDTQQHWVVHGDDLYLVYTRRGADNDHVYNHRAPLFIAQVDTERLRVIRDTEQILVPNRGARLGNFGVAGASDNETWVAVAEWMQTTAPDHHDFTVCERYGSDNSLYLVKIRFDG